MQGEVVYLYAFDVANEIHTRLVEQILPEMVPLYHCPQDPEWHPEGDVWTHTLLCLDQAAQLLDDLDRQFPGIRFRMIDEQNRMRPHIVFFVRSHPGATNGQNRQQT